MEFVKSLTKAFVISPTDTRVRVIQYPRYSTYAGKVLKMMSEKLFNDVRKGVPRVLVVITDGWSSDDVAKPSAELRMTGVKILSVGLGTHYNKAQLNVMASYPQEDHVFAIYFSQMSNIVMAIQDMLCKGKSCIVLNYKKNIAVNE